jgi:hypothetical protein
MIRKIQDQKINAKKDINNLPTCVVVGYNGETISFLHYKKAASKMTQFNAVFNAV